METVPSWPSTGSLGYALHFSSADFHSVRCTFTPPLANAPVRHESRVKWHQLAAWFGVKDMDLKILSETAAALFAKHGLVGWTFGLTASKRRLGVCKYRRKRIEISDYYAQHNPDAAVLDTLLHEIAHAIAGPEAGHSPLWQAVAVRIGATPRACDDSPDTVVEPGDWRTTCPECRRTHHRYKRPRSLSG